MKACFSPPFLLISLPPPPSVYLSSRQHMAEPGGQVMKRELEVYLRQRSEAVETCDVRQTSLARKRISEIVENLVDGIPMFKERVRGDKGEGRWASGREVVGKQTRRRGCS